MNEVVTLSRSAAQARGPKLQLSLLTVCLVWGCEVALPPLRGKIEVGRDAYAVFVGGSALRSDLYAVRGNGGPAFPLTYTAVAELAPALAPDGASLAFLRARSLRDSTPATVWLMNLLSGAEREVELPQGAGTPRRVGWHGDGHTLVVQTDAKLYRFNAPPARPDPRPVETADRPAAERSMAVQLGDPVFARVVPCETTGDLCVVGDTGAPAVLARGAREAVRWGRDSVAFFVGDQFQIRPVGRGRPRVFQWTTPPEKPRQVTFFAGKRVSG